MTLREEAENLNISVHTLKNWQRRKEKRQKSGANLISRANKLNSTRKRLPEELLGRSGNRSAVAAIIDNLTGLPMDDIRGRILYFVLHFLKFRNLTDSPSLHAPVMTLSDCIASLEKRTPEPLAEELRLRLKKLPKRTAEKRIENPGETGALFARGLKQEQDLPGLVYQGLRREGQRSREGAWFTPVGVIDSMIHDSVITSEGFFDPCCGSGLFLCRFAELKGSVSGVGGMDMDPTAVFLSRINLFIRFPDMNDLSSIREGNGLGRGSWNLNTGVLIATNPPWGAHMGPREKKVMRTRYPEIRSAETASLFIRKTVEELPSGGRGIFLLPESLCYVQAHKDLREFLLKEAPPVKLVPRERLFHGVYSRVFSCEIVKGGNPGSTVVSPGSTQPLERYRQNPASVFNIHCSNREAALIEKAREFKGLEIPDGSLWLLGVVTGDNSRFVTSDPASAGPPLITGRDISPFRLAPPRLSLKTEEGPLQQSRQKHEYMQPKLVYRFIGSAPVFALDRKGLITLNSANSLVLPDMALMEEAAFWFNSSLFHFLWQKQFASVKMLRTHLEYFPLPLWEKSEKSLISTLVQNAEKGQDISSPADELIFRHFEMTEEERDIVLKFKGN